MSIPFNINDLQVQNLLGQIRLTNKVSNMYYAQRVKFLKNLSVAAKKTRPIGVSDYAT